MFHINAVKKSGLIKSNHFLGDHCFPLHFHDTSYSQEIPECLGLRLTFLPFLAVEAFGIHFQWPRSSRAAGVVHQLSQVAARTGARPTPRWFSESNVRDLVLVSRVGERPSMVFCNDLLVISTKPHDLLIKIPTDLWLF